MNSPAAQPDWPMLLGPTLMSNFDHEVDQEVAQRLQSEKVIAKYSGWNFNADCWFTDDRYHAAVYVLHHYVDTFSADTPEELMMIVSNAYGYE